MERDWSGALLAPGVKPTWRQAAPRNASTNGERRAGRRREAQTSGEWRASGAEERYLVDGKLTGDASVGQGEGWSGVGEPCTCCSLLTCPFSPGSTVVGSAMLRKGGCGEGGGRRLAFRQTRRRMGAGYEPPRDIYGHALRTITRTAEGTGPFNTGCSTQAQGKYVISSDQVSAGPGLWNREKVQDD